MRQKIRIQQRHHLPQLLQLQCYELLENLVVSSQNTGGPRIRCLFSSWLKNAQYETITFTLYRDTISVI